MRWSPENTAELARKMRLIGETGRMGGIRQVRSVEHGGNCRPHAAPGAVAPVRNPHLLREEVLKTRGGQLGDRRCVVRAIESQMVLAETAQHAPDTRIDGPGTRLCESREILQSFRQPDGAIAVLEQFPQDGYLAALADESPRSDPAGPTSRCISPTVSRPGSA